MKPFDPGTLAGIYSATFTPYTAEGDVNPDMLRKIVEYHLGAGLRGFYVTGSTGEAFLLTEDERKRVIETVVEANAGRGRVIAHIGHISTDAAVRLARFAASCGVDAVSAVGPVYFGTTVAGAWRHYSEIAGATDLPLILYSLEGIGRGFDPETEITYFDIPHVAGMKYTGSNFFQLQELMRRVGKPAVFFSGSDQLFMAGLCYGVHGSIGTTQNFAPGVFVRIHELFRAGKTDEARALQAKINRVIYLMDSFENFSYRKAMMKFVGFDCGPFRKPFCPLTPEEFTALCEQLEKLGLERAPLRFRDANG
jgi:N-acetylneuraminate lyase